MALRRLKDACFKVDVHLMPNLPGASLAADTAMFERMLRDEAMQADQWKIYPTQVANPNPTPTPTPNPNTNPYPDTNPNPTTLALTRCGCPSCW